MSSHRETLVGSLRRNQDLRETLRLGLQETYKVEMQAVVNTASLARTNGMVQQALSAATYLSKMAPVCGEVDVRIDAVASRETANVLWAQGEVAMSVKMLQELCSRNDLDRQAIPVGRADMLAQLVRGSQRFLTCADWCRDTMLLKLVWKTQRKSSRNT